MKKARRVRVIGVRQRVCTAERDHEPEPVNARGVYPWRDLTVAQGPNTARRERVEGCVAEQMRGGARRDE